MNRHHLEALFIPVGYHPIQTEQEPSPSGERLLAITVVQDAAEIAAGKRVVRADLRAKTEEWIASKSEVIQSFHWWCQLIGLEPDYLRGLIKQSRRETMKRGSRRGMTNGAWRNIGVGWR